MTLVHKIHIQSVDSKVNDLLKCDISLKSSSYNVKGGYLNHFPLSLIKFKASIDVIFCKKSF